MASWTCRVTSGLISFFEGGFFDFELIEAGREIGEVVFAGGAGGGVVAEMVAALIADIFASTMRALEGSVTRPDSEALVDWEQRQGESKGVGAERGRDSAHGFRS